MEAFDKLRKLASDFRSDVYKRDEADYLSDIADEIEEEINRNWMRVPVGKDGEPFHIGDQVIDSVTKRTVVAISDSGIVLNRYDSSTGDSIRFGLACNYAHFKPDPLQDLLHEFVKDYKDSIDLGYDKEECVKLFAGKIRDLMEDSD